MARKPGEVFVQVCFYPPNFGHCRTRIECGAE